MRRGEGRGAGLLALALALVGVVALAWPELALAQSNPFGGPPRGGSAAEPGGVVAWLWGKQAELYRGLSSAIRAVKTDPAALFGLFGLAFAYGVVHAAGPGHGKAVISSYVVANDETWRRGVALSFASAFLQSCVAIAVVGVAAVLLGAGAKAIGQAARVIEIASYALIMAVGARLLWRKGGALVAALRASHAGAARVSAGAAATPTDHTHSHVHSQADHHHHHHHHHHDAACGHCGHSHGPQPHELGGPGGLRRGFAAILATGLRPCSGAILVLAFALAQGLFWAGVGATLMMGLGTALTVAAIATLAVTLRGAAMRMARGRAGTATALGRGLEFAAAGVVFAFGTLLLFGYLAEERLFGVCPLWSWPRVWPISIRKGSDWNVSLSGSAETAIPDHMPLSCTICPPSTTMLWPVM